MENPTSPLGFGGFGLASNFQLYEYLTTSSNFLGGVVYPSSYLLPGLQNRGAEWSRARLYAISSRSWSSSFFHHFSNTFFHRFWLHLGSQNGSKIDPKSSKNRSKNSIEKLSTFGTDFSSIFGGFWNQLELKNLQKRCERYQFSSFC